MQLAAMLSCYVQEKEGFLSFLASISFFQLFSLDPELEKTFHDTGVSVSQEGNGFINQFDIYHSPFPTGT